MLMSMVSLGVYVGEGNGVCVCEERGGEEACVRGQHSNQRQRAERKKNVAWSLEWHRTVEEAMCDEGRVHPGLSPTAAVGELSIPVVVMSLR